jgi:pimeloyl-ACP methyl ester carboxylesterase
MFRSVIGIAAGALLILIPAAHAQAQPTAKSRGHVVLLSNLLGAPGSFGLYFLANKLERRLGVQTDVRFWGSFWFAANELQRIKAADPGAVLVLVGHSQGANRAAEAAQILATRGVPVDLVVTLTPGGWPTAAPNVRRFVNLYFNGMPLSSRVEPAPGFRGELVNEDLSHDWTVWHATMDKMPSVQDRVVEEVRTALDGAVYSTSSTTPATSNPAAVREGQRGRSGGTAAQQSGNPAPLARGVTLLK